MNIKFLLKFIGVREPIRILDSSYKEIIYCFCAELPKQFYNKEIKFIYASGRAINVVLDKEEE